MSGGVYVYDVYVYIVIFVVENVEAHTKNGIR